MDPGTRPGCLERVRPYHVQPRAPAGGRTRTARWGSCAGQMDQLLCVRVLQLFGVVIVLTVCYVLDMISCRTWRASSSPPPSSFSLNALSRFGGGSEQMQEGDMSDIWAMVDKGAE